MTNPPDPQLDPAEQPNRSEPADRSEQPNRPEPAEQPEQTGEAGPAGQSGLRNPAGAVRGIGAGALVLQALALLLAIQPVRQFGGESGPTRLAAVIVIAVLAVLAVALAGLLRHAWAWRAASLLQVVLIAAGLLHWSLAVLGLIFALVWGYVLYVRRRVLTT